MTNLKNELQKKATGNEKPKTPVENVQSWLNKLTPEFERALPKHVTVDRLLRIALTTIKSSPNLLNCSMGSLMGAIMQACVLGLEINTPLGHCYIIPFNNRKLGMHQATFILGYQGVADLVWRTGKIASMQARAVYDGDTFEYEFGRNEFIRHIPSKDFSFDKPITHFYAYATTKDGAFHGEVFVKAKVDWWKQTFSPSKNSNDSPWNKKETYPQMGCKTVLKQCCKLLPKSIELATAISNDEIVKKDPLLLENIINSDIGIIDLQNEDINLDEEKSKVKNTVKNGDTEEQKKEDKQEQKKENISNDTFL